MTSKNVSRCDLIAPVENHWSNHFTSATTHTHKLYLKQGDPVRIGGISFPTIPLGHLVEGQDCSGRPKRHPLTNNSHKNRGSRGSVTAAGNPDVVPAGCPALTGHSQASHAIPAQPDGGTPVGAGKGWAQNPNAKTTHRRLLNFTTVCLTKLLHHLTQLTTTTKLLFTERLAQANINNLTFNECPSTPSPYCQWGRYRS